MKYVALDFETANSSPCSACSVGVSVFENHQLLYSYAQLINPPKEYNTFHWYNIKVHKIQPNMVRNAPSFPAVWEYLQQDIDNSVVVCHNAMFDTAVLCKTLSYYTLPYPTCYYICTVKVSQKVWPTLTNHKLNTVAESLHIALNHHEAGSDALACGLILQAALGQTHCTDVNTLAQNIGMRLGQISPDGCISCSTAQEINKKLR